MIVSIIVPVFNAEEKVELTIKSILNQTFEDFELILVNDGSSDNSGSICDHYSKLDSRIKIIHQKNLGPSSARNSGIKESNGRYITFIDADDTVDSNWLSMMLELEKQSNADLIIAGYKRLIKKNKLITKTKVISPNASFFKSNQEILSNIESLIAKGIFNPLWNKLYKSEIIKENNLTLNKDYSLGEDFLFNINYIEKCNNIFISSESHYNYIVDHNSLTHRYRDNKFNDLKDVTMEYRDFLKKHNSSLDSYYFRLLRNCYSSFMELFHQNSNMNKKEKMDYIEKIVDDKVVKEMMTLYNPDSINKKFILGILRSKNLYLIYLFTRIFHFKKFVIDKM